MVPREPARGPGSRPRGAPLTTFRITGRDLTIGDVVGVARNGVAIGLVIALDAVLLGVTALGLIGITIG